MEMRTSRRSHVEADRPLARQIGSRLRKQRLLASLTQAQLAEGRYTKAYVSALENGLVKPSMAALNFFASRLAIPVEQLLADREQAWTRLEADLLLASGDWVRATDAFSRLLESHPPDPVRAGLLLGLAEGLSRMGNGAEAVRAAAEAGALLAAQGRLREAAWATYWESSGLYEMERGDQASGLLTRLLDDIAAGLAVDPDLPVRALIALAMVASRDDEPERSLGYLEQARSRAAELDDRRRAVFLFSLALSYRELGDYEGAIATGTQSLATFRATEADGDAAAIENELALVYLALGNLERAATYAANARAYYEGQHDEWWLAHVTETQGQIALAAGSVDEAARLSAESLRLADARGNRKAALDALLLQARTQRAGSDLQAASDTLERAAGLAEEFGRRGQMQAVLSEWSDVLAERGDLVQALAVSRRAIDAGRH